MLRFCVVERAEERPAIEHSTAYYGDPRLGSGSHRIAPRPGRPELRELRRVAQNIPLVLCMVGSAAMAQQDSDDHAERMAQGLDVFRTEVQPLFVSDCIQCHGHGQVMGGLDLTSQGSLMASGKIGDSAESSVLVAVLRHERQPFMPFGQDKLSDEKIDAVAGVHRSTC